jgi:hypothetical protein
MTWRWHTCSERGACFSFRPGERKLVALCLLLVTPLLPAAQLSGQVELTNSKDPAVRRNRDYGGVVIWLEPVGRAAPRPHPGTRK